MAVLDATNRERVKRFFLRQGDVLGTCAFTKPDLVAAIAAIDDWIEANSSSFNSALPQPFRSAATQDQKIRLFCWVATRRAGILHVEEDD